MAAAWWSAPDGLVSHPTAAQLWGFEGITGDDVHITLATSRNIRSELVIVHCTKERLPADVGWRGPIPATSALRTAIDLAGVVDAGALEIAIESALRRRLFTVGQLRWRAEALAHVDLAYPDARVVLEYDSDQWHSGVGRRHRDAQRRNAIRALGWTVIEITPADLKESGRLLELVEMVEVVEMVLAA